MGSLLLHKSKEELSYPVDWNAQSILDLRHAAGLTQKQLAEWLRVTVKQVKHLENKRRNPSGPVTHLLDILRARVSDGEPLPVQPLFQVVGATQHETVRESRRPSKKNPVTDVSPAQVPALTDEAEVEDAADDVQDGAFLWET